MDDFISEKTAVREKLSGAKLSVSLPKAAQWEEKMASFRAPAEKNTSVTVGTEVPVEPYGEEKGAVTKFFRRALRKCFRWYAEPLVTRQNEVNRALLERIEELEAELERLKGTDGK